MTSLDAAQTAELLDLIASLRVRVPQVYESTFGRSDYFIVITGGANDPELQFYLRPGGVSFVQSPARFGRCLLCDAKPLITFFQSILEL